MFHSPRTAVWPPVYRHSFIHLMVQTPYVLFVYWEVNERKRKMIEDHYRIPWSSLPKIVRFYAFEEDSTTLDHPAMWVDVEVAEASSWYYREARPRMAYVADYGFSNAAGQFVPLLRSNRAETPLSKFEPAVMTEQPAPADPLSTMHGQQAPAVSSLSDNHSPFVQFSTYTLYPTQEGAMS